MEYKWHAEVLNISHPDALELCTPASEATADQLLLTLFLLKLLFIVPSASFAVAQSQFHIGLAVCP